MSELPDGWVQCSLEDCVEILDSLRVPINNVERQQRIEGKNADQLYPYYGATGQVGLIDNFLFDEELIALGEDGVPFFDPMKPKAYMLHGKTWVNNHAHVLRGLNSVSTNKFVLHYLNQFDYHGFVNGGTRLKLTQASMRKIPVTLPPLAEQTRIAAKLDELLAQVDTLKARIDGIPALLKRFRQTVQESAVSGMLMRGFVDAGHVSFEDSSVKELVSEPLRNGKSVKDGIGSKVLRLSALKSGIIDIRESKLGDWSGINVAPYLVRSGDFLVSRGNGSKDLVGRGGVVGSIREEIAFPDTMIRIRPDPSIMQLQYFAIAWHSRSVRAQIESIAKTTAGIWKISQADLGEIRLPVPTPEEQTEIVRRVEQLFAFADQLEARVAAAQERIDKLTQSILAKAFRGELVPQDPNDEPASVLLERIKAQRAAAPKTKRGRKTAK